MLPCHHQRLVDVDPGRLSRRSQLVWCGLHDLLQPQRVHPALRQVDVDVVLVDRLPAFEVEAFEVHYVEVRS